MAAGGKKTWVDVQKRTFTNWTNNALSNRQMKVNEIHEDFDDGVMMINLFEILTGKRMPTYDKKPRMRAQSASNIMTALKFIKDDGVKLVNIGPEDILDHNLKLHLGLIWSLILRYQIVGIESGSPKALLLEWVNRKIAPYPVAKVTDFKGSWSDGDAITALSDAMQRGLCPLEGRPGNPVSDIDRALKSVGGLDPPIPQVMDAVDMHDALDDLACMTQIAMYKDWDENKRQRDADREKANNCWMDGPGLEHGYTKTPNFFTIHSCDQYGKPEQKGGDEFDVRVTGPGGQPAKVNVSDNGDGTYGVTYETQTPGKYTVEAMYDPPGVGAHLHIRDSPKDVQVDHSVDASKSYATGPGLENGRKNNEPAEFRVHTVDPNGNPLHEGGKDIEVRVRGPDPSGCDVAVNDNGDGTYDVAYQADVPGDYEIDVLAGGDHIKGSTFFVRVEAGIQAELVTGQFTYTVQAKDKDGNPITQGGADWAVSISGPNDSQIDVSTTDNGDGSYSAQYELVAQEGADSEFVVTCTLNGDKVGNSPFKHRLGPKPSVAQKLKSLWKGITGKGGARTIGECKTDGGAAAPQRGLPSTPGGGGGGGGGVFCTECGVKTSVAEKFCTECGAARG